MDVTIDHSNVPSDETFGSNKKSLKTNYFTSNTLVRHRNRTVTSEELSIDNTQYKKGDSISDKDWMNLIRAIIENSVFRYIIGNENRTDIVILINTSPNFNIEIYREPEDTHCNLLDSRCLEVSSVPEFIKPSERYRRVLCKEIIVDNSHYTRGSFIDYKTCERIVNYCLNTSYYTLGDNEFTVINTIPTLDISRPSDLSHLPFCNLQNISYCFHLLSGGYIHHLRQFYDTISNYTPL